MFIPKVLYIIQVPINALKSKTIPTAHSIKEYEVGPWIIGAGIKNNATINLKTLSALF